MFKSKTLFIVGAGASCEAELPSGFELKTKIGEKLNLQFDFDYHERYQGELDISHALQRHSPNSEELEKYRQAGKRYFGAMHQASSIDNYLDAHQNDKYTNLCGKLGIAKTILEAERTSLLYVNETKREKMNFATLENTWYGAFQKILMDVEKSNISKLFENVSFITFNYDRCIEHFLVHAVTNYYGVPFHEVSALVNQVVIRHPYGVVGLLPWQDLAQNVQPVSFGQVGNPDLLEIARQINTFTEQQEDNQKLTAIRRTVQEAEVIVFLGFAFHERNMELLSPGDSYRAKKIYLTRKGISDSDMQVVINSINSTLRGGVNPNTFLGDVDPNVFTLNSSCVGLFNEFGRSLAS